MNDLATRRLETVLAPAADRYNTDPATTGVRLRNYSGVRFILAEGAGTTGTAVVTVEEATAADGTGAQAIPFRYRRKDGTDNWGAWQAATDAGFTTAVGGTQVYELEVRDRALTAGFDFVRVQLTEGVDAPTVAAVLAESYGARYAEEPPVAG